MGDNPTLREQLVEAGLWDERDRRDPAADPAACAELEARFEKKFGRKPRDIIERDVSGGVGAVPSPQGLTGAPPAAPGGTRAEAVCRAALRFAARPELWRTEPDPDETPPPDET